MRPGREYSLLAGCSKSPPAAFSHRSDPQRTPRVRLGPSLAAALLDCLFEHPAGECEKRGYFAFAALFLALAQLTGFLPARQLCMLFHCFDASELLSYFDRGLGMTQSEYVFQRVEDQRELDRLRMIEQVFDSSSRRRLLDTGLKASWRCLEVGPGAGSIMTWMGEVVGPTGQVVAVDLDQKFLSEAERPNVSVVRADIRTAQLPHKSFDLVHARYVLIHLPDYEIALTKMFDSLKPGGWLVLEEPDFSASRGITGGEQELASLRKVNQAIEQMYATLRMDYALGLKLPALMQRRALQYLTVENDAPLCAGGSGMATVMKLSAEQLREKYLATGIVGQSDLERYRRFADDPNTWAVYYATIAVSGQKAGE